MKREPFEDSIIAALRTDCEIKTMIGSTIRDLPVSLSEIKREADKDDFICEIKNKIAMKDDKVPEVFSLCDEVLLYGERVVIPKSLQKRILRDFHMGHPGKNQMKSLMRSYVYWSNMDKDIMEIIDSCRGCAQAAKAPPITFKPWLKTDQPWSRIHIDFAGPLNDHYYLIIVDSYTKWPEVLRCKRPTTGTTIDFLHELFARFGVVDCIVSNNGTQFTSAEFKSFCSTFQVKHITTPQYHPRSNGQAERFVDTLKRALKKAQGTPMDEALQQFLHVYRITPNPNTPIVVSPVETMFTRKVRSVFDKLLPKQTRPQVTTCIPGKRFIPGERVFFKSYKNNTSFWDVGTISKRVSDMVYIVQGPRHTHKRHQNQLRIRRSDDTSDTPPLEEEPIDTIFKTFDLEPPQPTPEQRRLVQKRKFTDPLVIDPKRKKILTAFMNKKSLGW